MSSQIADFKVRIFHQLDMVVWILWATVPLLFLSGCIGKTKEVETAPVSGKVTLEGEPLPWGIVTFTPKRGRSASGLIQDNGSYRLSTYGEADGAAIGEHDVTVICTNQKPDAPIDPLAPVPLPKWLIPRRYAQPSLSGLSFRVEANVDNIANFDLEKE